MFGIKTFFSDGSEQLSATTRITRLVGTKRIDGGNSFNGGSVTIPDLGNGNAWYLVSMNPAGSGNGGIIPYALPKFTVNGNVISWEAPDDNSGKGGKLPNQLILTVDLIYGAY